MKKKFAIVLFIITAFYVTNCSAQTIDIKAEKVKVKLVVDEFYKTFETKDMKLLSGIVAHDSKMVNYGMNANLIFVGWNALQDSLTKMLAVMEKTKMNIKNQVINVDPTGNFAWFSEMCDMDLEYAGHPMQINGQRYTGVLEKRNGKWLIVQFHNSVTCQ
ncbi:MAG: nuclear transport factor 2 family protein [Bacteroidota bacterium]|nr:nuclear transport factor 2 family protein [Bacteroidota bacterium]